VPQVQRRDGFGLQPFGDCHDHAVDEPQTQGSVSSTKALGFGEILITPPFNRQRSLGEVGQEGLFRAGPELRSE
jgi:hypothetical protein